MAEIIKQTETVAVKGSSGLVSGGIVAFIRRITGFKMPKFRISRRTLPRFIIPVVLFVALLVGIRLAFMPRAAVESTNISIAPDAAPIATMEINREFNFPIRDEKAKEVGKLAYSIETAELRKQIIVQGKRATTVEGRVFLILNLKVANTLNQGMEINTRDYVRISVNNSNEFFAPEIHNDPVEVQAISTKNTRLGLAINENDKDIKLQIGEIEGEKQIIPISF